MRRLTASILALCFCLVSCGGDPNPTSPSPPSPPPPPPRALFAQSGIGNDVFSMPLDVEIVRITGRYTGSSANFIVWIGDDLEVNEILGTFFGSTTYEGNHAVTGGLTRIENSTGVEWSITEIR